MIIFRLKEFTENYKVLEEVRNMGITDINQLSSFQKDNPDYIAAFHRVTNEKKPRVVISNNTSNRAVPKSSPTVLKLLEKALKKYK